MRFMNRRSFLRRTTGTVGAALAANMIGCSDNGESVTPTAEALAPPKGPLQANDVITLGKTGIKTSRLALGTGSRGGHVQKELGTDGLTRFFRHGLDQGICWWDTATSYATMPHVEAALKEIPRDKVVITCKTREHDYDGVRKDIDKLRKQFNSDYIDILLLHCMTDPDWPRQMKGPMDALSEAKQEGTVRAVGCSCHTFGALKAAADEPWVEVDLARINPYAVMMDVNELDEVGTVEQVLQTMHDRGKVVYGMKIFGEGRFNPDQMEDSLRFALSRPYLTGFTIGFANQDELDETTRRIESVTA